MESKKKEHARILDLIKSPDIVNYAAEFGKNLFGINMDGDALNLLGNIIIREKGFNLNVSPTSSAA